MKILILCSHRYYAPYTDYVAPFIYEQMQSLRPLGCEFQVCFVRGNGIKAYLRAFRSLRRQIADFQPDIIHAHYGLCCFLANMQRRVPVVSTFLPWFRHQCACHSYAFACGDGAICS